MSRLSLSALTSGNRISFFILLLPRVTFKTCNLLLAGPCRAELVRTCVNKQNWAGERKQDHVRRQFLLFLLCGEARVWKSVFSSGFKRSRVKMGCFDVFISLTFLLSDVIVNGQTVQFFGTIVVAIKPRKIHVVGFSFIIFKLQNEIKCAAGKCPDVTSETQFFVAISAVRKMS